MDYDYCGKKYYLRRVDQLEIHVRRRDPDIGFPDGCSVASVLPAVVTAGGECRSAVIRWDASFGTLTKEEILFIYARLYCDEF
jgi:hypothetical protein